MKFLRNILLFFSLMFIIQINSGAVLADDQYDWKAAKSGFNDIFTSVAYGDNKLAAVGQGGGIIISYDNGESWLKTNSGTREPLEQIIWGGNQFIAVGAAGSIYTSPDGVKWTKAFSNPDIVLKGIAFANDCYVAVGFSKGEGIILVSADGTNWTKINSGIKEQFIDVIWGNNEFTVIGKGSVLTSRDGKEWRTGYIIKGNNLSLATVAWGENGYVAGGAGKSILVSADGTEWTEKALPTEVRFKKIIWADGKYISAMQSPIIGVSSDGINWTNIFTYLTGNIFDILYEDNKLIGMGDKDNIYIGTEIEEDLSSNVLISVNGANIEFPDIKPFFDRNNRTMVPVRFIAEALGAEVQWKGDTSTVSIKKGDINISLKIGDMYAKVGVNTLPLDSPGRIVNGRTMVPLRFVAECLNSKVEWDGSTNSVNITGKNAADTDSDNQVSEIIAANVDEFFKSIGSNRKILLKPGMYDLSRTTQTDKSDSTAVWHQVTDGRELIIQNISNLTIEGIEPETVVIRTGSNFANIMKFINADNITIKNISAGHYDTKNTGDGGVLSFENCDDVSITDSTFYNGASGISLNNVKRFNLTSSKFVNSKYLQVIQINNSESVHFKGVGVINQQVDNVLDIVDSKDILFEECNFVNNKIFGSGFAELTGNTEVVFNNCKLTNINKIDINPKYDAVYFIKITDQKDNTEIKIIFKDTQITNTKFDYLSGKKDAITFENSKLTNCYWDM